MVTAIRISGIEEESIVDGPGLRYVLFTQGCPHNCPGCHNPETHAFTGGRLISQDEAFADIRKNPLTRGVTFSGGEPFAQSDALTLLAVRLKKAGYHLTCYTGYVFEELFADARFHPLLEQLDLLIDGPFILAQKSLILRFRGSRNQRILDVPRSLAAGAAVLRPLHS
ncbi:MAG: anaerobic ribonucleoside-triphosphate reductase activating protein [Bilophila sp.]